MGVFHFRQFDVDDCNCGMKICSDSVTFAAWFLNPYREAAKVLDIGAGSGLLSLIAAVEMPDALIDAVEIDAKAAKAAAKNFAASTWSCRLHSIHSALADFVPMEKYDIIMSNPPFFTNGALSADDSRAGARHENSLNIVAICRFAAKYLESDGHLGVILPFNRADEAVFEAELAGLKLRRLCCVAGRLGKTAERALLDFSLTDGAPSMEELVVRDAKGTLTTEYMHLVEHLYVKIS